jgi:uncharacterized protein
MAEPKLLETTGGTSESSVRETPSMPEQRVVAEGVFTWPSQSPQLIGARCSGCGVVTFPRQGSCPRCTGQDLVEHLLPRTGTLWSWTIQGFLPKNPPYAGTETPLTFRPYGVGYVQLADEVIVESRLTTADPAELVIGGEMHLVIEAFTTDTEGRDVLTFAFAPGAPA